MSRTVYRRLLFATFTGNLSEVDAIAAEAAEVPWQDSALLISAVFGLAVEKHFNGTTDPDSVAAFVDDAITRFASVDRDIAIDIVKLALGEEVPLDRLNSMQSMQIQAALTHHVFALSGATPDEINEILDHAEMLLDMTAPMEAPE